MINIRIHFFVIVLMVGFLSCSPKVEDVTYKDLDINLTYRQDGVDFQEYATYALPDSVYIVSGDLNTTDSFALARVDQVTLSEIEAQMKSYGYTKVDTSANPDVALIVSRLILDYTGGGFTPGYCYPSYGWGYPDYGWCYPGYDYTYSYSTGTILVDLLDLKNFSSTSDESPEATWRFVANGYLKENVYLFDENRVRTNIARGFEQSPYLDIR